MMVDHVWITTLTDTNKSNVKNEKLEMNNQSLTDWAQLDSTRLSSTRPLPGGKAKEKKKSQQINHYRVFVEQST